MWASRRTHWRMSPPASPGRFFLKNHSSIWVMRSKREPLNRGGPRWTWQRLTPASLCSASAPECSDSCTKGPWHVQHASQTRWCNADAGLICSPSQFFSTPSPRSATGSRVIQPQADRFSLVLAGALPVTVQIKWFHSKTSKTIREIPVNGAPGFKIRGPGFGRDNRLRRLFVPVLRIGHMVFPHSNRSNFTAAGEQTAHGQTANPDTGGAFLNSEALRRCYGDIRKFKSLLFRKSGRVTIVLKNVPKTRNKLGECTIISFPLNRSHTGVLKWSRWAKRGGFLKLPQCHISKSNTGLVKDRKNELMTLKFRLLQFLPTQKGLTNPRLRAWLAETFNESVTFDLCSYTSRHPH